MSASPSSADSLLAIKTLAVAPRTKQKINVDFSADSVQKNDRNGFRDAMKNTDKNFADNKAETTRQTNKSDKIAENSEKTAEKQADSKTQKSSDTERPHGNESKKTCDNDCKEKADNPTGDSTIDSENAVAANPSKNSSEEGCEAAESLHVDENVDGLGDVIVAPTDAIFVPVETSLTAADGGELLPHTGQKITATHTPELPLVTAEKVTVGEVTTVTPDNVLAYADDVDPATKAVGTTPQSHLPLPDAAIPKGMQGASTIAAPVIVEEASVVDAEMSLAKPAEKAETVAQATNTLSELAVDEDANSAIDNNINNNRVEQPVTTRQQPSEAPVMVDTDEETFKPQMPKVNVGLDNVPQEGNRSSARTDAPLLGFQGPVPTVRVDAVATAAKIAAEKTETKGAAAIDSASSARATPNDAKWNQTLNTLQQMRAGNSPENAQFKLPLSLQNREWGSAVADKVMWMASQNIRSAEVHLDPPELGPMQVRIAVNHDQVSVNFISHQATVRDMLDQNAFRLREMFEQGGLNLVDVDVSDRNAQQRQKDNGDDPTGSGLPGVNEGEGSGEAPGIATALTLTNLVDYYA